METIAFELTMNLMIYMDMMVVINQQMEELKANQLESNFVVKLAEAERLLKETLTCNNNDKDGENGQPKVQCNTLVRYHLQ